MKRNRRYGRPAHLIPGISLALGSYCGFAEDNVWVHKVFVSGYPRFVDKPADLQCQPDDEVLVANVDEMQTIVACRHAAVDRSSAARSIHPGVSGKTFGAQPVDSWPELELAEPVVWPWNEDDDEESESGSAISLEELGEGWQFARIVLEMDRRNKLTRIFPSIMVARAAVRRLIGSAVDEGLRPCLKDLLSEEDPVLRAFMDRADLQRL